jgi:trimeric autotransporter adhesin
LTTTIVTLYAGTGSYGSSGDGGPATSATFSAPMGLWGTTDGILFVGDYDLHSIRKIDNNAAHIITEYAGNILVPGFSGDGGAASSALMKGLGQITGDTASNIYITDSGNNRVRKVTYATGIITTYAGNGIAASIDNGVATSGSLGFPFHIFMGTGVALYISDFTGHKIRKVSSTGAVTTVAGLASLDSVAIVVLPPMRNSGSLEACGLIRTLITCT